MSRIAVLGLGAMGSRMAANLIKAGHEVTVWNRSPDAAADLIAAGAHHAATPRAAAAGTEFAISMVRDDNASQHVWLEPTHGALAGMSQGAVMIESSTLTPDWVSQLGAHAAQAGVSLLEAPVSGSRVQAETGQLIYLVGGDEATLAIAEPVLRSMGTAIHLVGPLGSGALTKLVTNALLGIQVTALAELVALITHRSADVETVLKAIASTSVWAPINNYLASTMMAGNFAPQFPIELIEKDFGYIMQVAGKSDVLPTTTASHALFQRAIELGLGHLNMTGVSNLYRAASENGNQAG